MDKVFLGKKENTVIAPVTLLFLNYENANLEELTNQVTPTGFLFGQIFHIDNLFLRIIKFIRYVNLTIQKKLNFFFFKLIYSVPRQYLFSNLIHEEVEQRIFTRMFIFINHNKFPAIIIASEELSGASFGDRVPHSPHLLKLHPDLVKRFGNDGDENIFHQPGQEKYHCTGKNH